MGFIADLPTELVAAFRATLEEVLEADVIVHVRDAAHDESAAQKADVLKVLEELGAGRPMLEVLNKIDLLEPGQRDGLLARNRRSEAIAVSALTGAGIADLLAAFEAGVTRGNITLTLKLDAADGGAWPLPIAMPRCWSGGCGAERSAFPCGFIPMIWAVSKAGFPRKSR